MGRFYVDVFYYLDGEFFGMMNFVCGYFLDYDFWLFDVSFFSVMFKEVEVIDF